MAEYTIFQNAEGDSDEPIPINKEGKKIKLQKVKLIRIKPVDSLGEQPEEKNYEVIENLIKILQKNSPLSDIYKVQDAQNKDVFIYEETLNKIEENKADPEKTTYKVISPLKEEVICGKKVKKTLKSLEKVDITVYNIWCSVKWNTMFLQIFIQIQKRSNHPYTGDCLLAFRPSRLAIVLIFSYTQTHPPNYTINSIFLFYKTLTVSMYGFTIDKNFTTNLP